MKTAFRAISEFHRDARCAKLGAVDSVEALVPESRGAEQK
jgi:hypothetical protein